MKRHLLLLLLMLFITPLCASAQEGPDIVRIMEYFVAFGVAAKKCSSPDEALENKFHENFLMVSIRAAQALKQRNPNMPEEELAKLISARTEALKHAVEDDIDKNGCGSNSAKQLLQLYKVNASWKP